MAAPDVELLLALFLLLPHLASEYPEAQKEQEWERLKTTIKMSTNVNNLYLKLTGDPISPPGVR
jgi:hypothetical protein